MTLPPPIDVLIIAHDPQLTGALLDGLHERQLATDVAGDLVETRRLLARARYKAVVLDLTMPVATPRDVLNTLACEATPSDHIIVIADSDGSRVADLRRMALKFTVFAPDRIADVLASIDAASHVRNSTH
jgi:DNA-binding NtrC family response regulator